MKYIKEYDLMHGDLYMVNNQVVKYDAVSNRFASLGFLTRFQRSHELACRIGEKDSEGFFSVWKNHHISPIPLTPEILEKNGWKKGWINGGWCYNHELKFLLSPNKDSLYLSITNHGVYIHHVHELQHALRLCGLNDLADNFKI